MRTGSEGRLPTSAGEGETADALIDLVEALTALGNYLSAVNHIVVGRLNGDPQQVIVETLEKALGQHERSVSALKRLRASQPPYRLSSHQ
jgi:hypothetical protein